MNRHRIQARPQHVSKLRFVESVKVRQTGEPVRVSWKWLLLGGFWFLIVAKCLLAHWAIVHWEMPVASVYVWGPTLFAAAICTFAFLGRREEETGT
jgi:hypothetical protein